MKYIKTFFMVTCISLLMISCANKNLNQLNENIIKITKVDEIIPAEEVDTILFKTKRNTFVTSFAREQQLKEISLDGETIKKVGGKGKGPGEFSFIYSLSESDDNYYVCDYENFRLSIFDEKLEFKNSFILTHNYIDEVVAYKNQLLLFGDCCKDAYNQQAEYYLSDVYKKDETSYSYQKSTIRIEDFPKFNSDKFVGINKSKALQNKNICHIAYSYSPNIISYDFETTQIKETNINFPGYINPLEINFKKLNKLGKSKWNLQYYPEHLFCYAPYFFWHDTINKRYMIQYHRPYQSILEAEKKSENSDRYIVVFFDENFQYLENFYIDNPVIYAENNEKETFIYTRTTPFFYKKDYEEQEQCLIEIFRMD